MTTQIESDKYPPVTVSVIPSALAVQTKPALGVPTALQDPFKKASSAVTVEYPEPLAVGKATLL